MISDFDIGIHVDIKGDLWFLRFWIMRSHVDANMHVVLSNQTTPATKPHSIVPPLPVAHVLKAGRKIGTLN